MNIIDILLIMLYGYICYKIGWTFRELYAKKEVQRMINEVHPMGEEDVVRIYFEKGSGFLFAYNYDTHEFIAQGVDRESLLEAMVSRFPKTKFIVEKEKLQNLL